MVYAPKYTRITSVPEFYWLILYNRSGYQPYSSVFWYCKKHYKEQHECFQYSLSDKN